MPPITHVQGEICEVVTSQGTSRSSELPDIKSLGKKKKKKTKSGVHLAEDPNEQDRRAVPTGKGSEVNILLRSSYGCPTG